MPCRADNSWSRTHSTLSNKKIKWIGADEFAPTTPVISAEQTSRVFDIVGMKRRRHEFECVVPGPRRLRGAWQPTTAASRITSASAVGGAMLIDGGVVALSNVTLKDNEAMGATGAQGSTGASRSAGPGGEGASVATATAERSTWRPAP